MQEIKKRLMQSDQCRNILGGGIHPQAEINKLYYDFSQSDNQPKFKQLVCIALHWTFVYAGVRASVKKRAFVSSS